MCFKLETYRSYSLHQFVSGKWCRKMMCGFPTPWARVYGAKAFPKFMEYFDPNFEAFQQFWGNHPHVICIGQSTWMICWNNKPLICLGLVIYTWNPWWPGCFSIRMEIFEGFPTKQSSDSRVYLGIFVVFFAWWASQGHVEVQRN